MNKADICKTTVYDLDKAIDQLRHYLSHTHRYGGLQAARDATRLINRASRRLTAAFIPDEQE